MATKDLKEGDGVVPRTKSLIPEVNHSSSGPRMFKLNTAFRIPSWQVICTNSACDCHLLTVAGISPASSQSFHTAAGYPLHQGVIILPLGQPATVL